MFLNKNYLDMLVVSFFKLFKYLFLIALGGFVGGGLVGLGIHILSLL